MNNAPLRIEPSLEADLPAILEIQNREIREGVALWNEAEKSLEEVAAWRMQRLGAGYPVLTARLGEAVVGYGGFGPFRPHDAYRDTVEHSLYVAPNQQRRGVGAALLAALEQVARTQGRHVMVGGVESGNAASIALHLAQGFVETARMPEVGRKFGRRLTLVLLQKTLL